MNHQSPETANQSHLIPETFRIDYTIQDGEHEYGDFFFLKSNWDSVEKEAHRKLAEFFAYGEEKEKEMLETLQTEGMAMIGCRAIKDLSIDVVEAVTVILRRGQIQDIQNIPEGGVIRVRDYDIHGVPDERTKQDENGDYYVESVWEGVVPISQPHPDA